MFTVKQTNRYLSIELKERTSVFIQVLLKNLEKKKKRKTCHKYKIFFKIIKLYNVAGT